MIKGVLDWARRKIFSTTFLKFGMVGASGVVVNYGIAYLGYITGLSDIISLAIGVGTLTNYFTSDLLVWPDNSTLKFVRTKAGHDQILEHFLFRILLFFP